MAESVDQKVRAAMLAFEEAWMKNRKKNKKKKKKKREIESHAQNDSELIILSDDSGDEVIKRSQRCETDVKGRMQSMEGKKRENNTDEGERGNNLVDVGIVDHKGRNGNASKAVADNKVSNGHTSKADEYQMLTDLTNFPYLAAMFAYEATWKKNRKKKKKNKKRKCEVGEQSDMNQYPQKPEQMTAIEASNLQELVIVPDCNVNGGMNNGQSCKINCEETTEVRVGKKKKGNVEEEEKHDNVSVQSSDKKVIVGHKSKADEYKMLTDLTDFPYLAAMLAFESTWTQNRKKKKRKKRQNVLKGINKMDAAPKEDTLTNTYKAVETTNIFNDDENVSSVMIIYLDSSSSEVEEVVADIGSSKAFREMVPELTSVKRKDNNILAQLDTVKTVEDDKQADSSKKMMPFQTKPVNSMDDILPRKLLDAQRGSLGCFTS